MVHLVIYRAMDSIMVAGINIDMLDCPKVTYIYIVTSCRQDVTTIISYIGIMAIFSGLHIANQKQIQNVLDMRN